MDSVWIVYDKSGDKVLGVYGWCMNKSCAVRSVNFKRNTFTVKFPSAFGSLLSAQIKKLPKTSFTEKLTAAALSLKH